MGRIKSEFKKTNTMMRIDKELLRDIKSCKIDNSERYVDVVRRIINKERNLKK
jgi:hypothetical protein